MNKNSLLPGIRWSIRQKITLGFASLLLVYSLVNALNVVGLNRFHERFVQFRTVSDDARQMLKIDHDVAELQRYIFAYSNTEKNTSIAQIDATYAQLVADIEFLVNHHARLDAQNQENIDHLLQAVRQFHEKIDSLPIERAYRTDLISKQLAEQHKKLRGLLNDIYTRVSLTENHELLGQIWKAQTQLFSVESLSGRYFSIHEFQLRQDVLRVSAELADTLGTMHGLAGAALIGEPLATALQTLVDTKVIFSQAVQADRNYLFLVNVVIAGESSEITSLTERLKANHLSKQGDLFEITKNDIESNRQWVFSSFIVGALVAMLLAYFIGRSITRPLQFISGTFARLARGENLSEIPGQNRTDEIGHLAQAANVFRENNARTVLLLEQTERFALELKERELQLEQAASRANDASVAKSQFLAKMSHELRTPMNAILGMLTLLQKTRLELRQRDYVEKTESAARSLLNLLNDILDISKAEAGKVDLELTPFHLDRMLEDLKIILATNIGKKNVRLRFDVAEAVPRYLLGDVFRLQQVLINLGGNAIKFTREGEVCIKISLDDQRDDQAFLTFSVADTGIGIAPENQQKIFGGFTQAEASTTRRFGGTGLGLSISQHLVALMGGTLQLESEPEAGSRFFFSIVLPMVTPESVAPAENTENIPVPVQRLKGMRILIAEDNENNQQIARELLESEGAQVQLVDNGQALIHALQTAIERDRCVPCDVILMDMQMPVMDGLEATRQLRQISLLRDMPVIAMTANAMQGDRDACMAAGMNDHVGKPFDLEHLVWVLRQHARFEGQWNQPDGIASPPVPREAARQHDDSVEFDPDGAIARFGGNETLYFVMLPKLGESMQNYGKKLTHAVEERHWSTVQEILHTLKGVAATAGLVKLARCADATERNLSLLASDNDRNQSVLTIQESLNQALTHVEEVLSRQAKRVVGQ